VIDQFLTTHGLLHLFHTARFIRGISWEYPWNVGTFSGHL